MRFVLHTICLLLVIVCFSQTLANAQGTNATFQDLIKKYEQSINDADSVQGSKFWSMSKETSFINPRGTEYGWSGVKDIYKMFGMAFSKRKLDCFNEKLTVYNDVAWVSFEWVFDATTKMNNQEMQTKGRETQIWKKEGKDWKLVHVHYSGTPVTGQGQGF